MTDREHDIKEGVLNMMNKIRERLSWDADCTILLVRFILAVTVVAGIVWYCQTHPYGGGSEILNRWNAVAANSESRPATAWEIITALITGLFALVQSFAVLLLPFLGFGLFMLTFFGLLVWLDSRGSQNNRIECNSEDTRDENG